MPWRLALCTCNGTLPWDGETIHRALGLPGTPAGFDRLSRDEIHRFMDWLSAGRAGGRRGAGAPPSEASEDVIADSRVLVACCGSAELFSEAARAAGVDPVMLSVVNAREACFRSHPQAEGANDKAARLLRAAMRLAESAAPAPRIPIHAGANVLIVTDSPLGLDLARRLGDVARPQLLLDERSAAFDASALHPLPFRVNWGRLGRVDGTLGAFRVTVEHGQPIDLRTCIHCMRCVPVCHVSAIGPGLRLRTDLCDQCGDCLIACEHVGAIKIPRDERELITADQVVVVTSAGGAAAPARSGFHHLRAPSAGDVDALAWKILGLIGDFERPQYVRYDALTCAGGAASHTACGRCIPACPYDAIERDPRNPLRVTVHDAACEGCGACVSTCPTSSLTFTDPPPAVLETRLRALLAPLSGAAPAAPVIAFHCAEQGAAAFSEAGRSGRPYPPSVLPVPMACLRQVSEADVLTALGYGAAGVALVGCAECPHGEREGLLTRIELARGFLDALGLGGERVGLITDGVPGATVMLDSFVADLTPSPIVWDGEDGAPAPTGRDALARALSRVMTATGHEPGRTRVPAGASFAFPDVRVAGCTVCRSCVNVCPTHAFRYDESRQTLELRQVACVNCGLCATACPESVITLRPETFLTHKALDYQVVVQDETLRCIKCASPFGNRRAIDVIEAKVLAMTNLLDTFAGSRRNLLRMCPSCRAVAATMEMQKGWEP